MNFLMTNILYSSNLKSDLLMLPHYFAVNAPAILFPYIRAYISLLTSLSGVGTVLLPTLNLSSLSKELLNNIKEE